MESVSLKNLSIGYKTGKNEKIIASDLNVIIPEGTLVCLLGPNGGGKSTLLKTVGGFLSSLKGNVYLGRKELNSMTPSEKSRAISVVLTQKPQFNSLTAYELVSLGRAPYTGFFGRLTDKDKKCIDKALESVGVAGLAERKVNSLSDGEKQKLMIAKAVAQDTPLIILDEPTAFLDYPSKAETMRLLNSLCHQYGKIVLVSTHDLDIVMATSDHLWLIDKEKGFTTGTVEQLANADGIGRYFNGKDMNFDPQTRHFTFNKTYLS